MFDVYFYEAFAEEEAALRSFLPASVCAGFTAATPQEAGHAEAPAALISVRTQSQIPLGWAQGLRGILTRSTGYDHILRYRQESGVAVAAGYLPLYCHRAVAEQAMLLWMALLRMLPWQQRQFHTFFRDGLTGRETAGKTLAVFGVGNIGYEVVRIGRGLDMRVLGVDLVARHDDVEYVTPESAVAQADIVVCAMNLTRTNRGYFSDNFWAVCRKGTIFVNISRGELSPPTALLAAYDAGILGGVALDVYDAESELAGWLRSGVVTSSPSVAATLALQQRPNVILTPHNAFNTEESVVRKSSQSIDQVRALLESGAFLWPVPDA